jgi:hypothetical protein
VAAHDIIADSYVQTLKNEVDALRFYFEGKAAGVSLRFELVFVPLGKTAQNAPGKSAIEFCGRSVLTVKKRRLPQGSCFKVGQSSPAIRFLSNSLGRQKAACFFAVALAIR